MAGHTREHEPETLDQLVWGELCVGSRNLKCSRAKETSQQTNGRGKLVGEEIY
jgi:hypothetical protein